MGEVGKDTCGVYVWCDQFHIQDEHYKCIGILVGMSLVQGGSGYPHYWKEEIEVKNAVEKVLTIGNVYDRAH